ncbi:hypothetical protein, partial [Nonomuraea sp. NPDC049784]|uniref:hypothetical protein n=1 Tax=Nonomuraea sp. NPDC049784 TaxID=3154361 RepID=UPI0033DAA71E
MKALTWEKSAAPGQPNTTSDSEITNMIDWWPLLAVSRLDPGVRHRRDRAPVSDRGGRLTATDGDARPSPAHP